MHINEFIKLIENNSDRRDIMRRYGFSPFHNLLISILIDIGKNIGIRSPNNKENFPYYLEMFIKNN